MEIDITALRMVEQGKGVPFGRLVEMIEGALLKVYHNIPGAISKACIKIDQKAGRITVVAMDEDEDGNEVGEFDDTPKNFGRIVQLTARSVITQHLRDADDQEVLGGLASQKGQVVTGIVNQSRDGRIMVIEVGDSLEAVLLDFERAPGEAHRHGDRIRAFVVNVKHTEKGVRIMSPRTYPGLAAGPFRREVPGVQRGLVRIKAIARKAGHRTEIAVATTREGVNVKGVCIGPMGSRVRAVMTKLNGEEVNIVDRLADPGRFVANALSPVRVSRVVVHLIDNRTATAIIPDFQLSLATGKERQNARLTIRLTDSHIDIHSDAETGDEDVVPHSLMLDDVTSRSYSDPQD